MEIVLVLGDFVVGMIDVMWVGGGFCCVLDFLIDNLSRVVIYVGIFVLLVGVCFVGVLVVVRLVIVLFFGVLVFL